jgi:hypothetical protein
VHRKCALYIIQGCILKMCRNFTYEVVGQRRRLKVTIKNCISKIKYFFRVLHEASSSWLKFFRVFRLHPLCNSSITMNFVVTSGASGIISNWKVYYVTKKGKHPFIDLDSLVVILRRPVPPALCSRPSGVHA